MAKPSSLRTPLKRARGLGASGTGTHHFWAQRTTAVALIPLSMWFVVTLVTALLGEDAAGIGTWLKSPLSALALSGLVLALFTHARLGIQVVIEDYVHAHGIKVATILLSNTLMICFGAASLMAIAKLHFFGA